MLSIEKCGGFIIVNYRISSVYIYMHVKIKYIHKPLFYKFNRKTLPYVLYWRKLTVGKTLSSLLFSFIKNCSPAVIAPKTACIFKDVPMEGEGAWKGPVTGHEQIVKLMTGQKYIIVDLYNGCLASFSTFPNDRTTKKTFIPNPHYNSANKTSQPTYLTEQKK